MLKVKDIMTKSVIACQSDTAIKEVARLMYLNGLTGLPVLNSAGQVVGIITEADLMKEEGVLHIPNFFNILGSAVYLDNPLNGDEVEKQLHEILAAKVSELMTREVVSIAPDADIHQAAELFLHKKGNPIPVIEGGKLVGIISRADIVKLVAGEKELREKQWTEIVQGSRPTALQ
ncbi:CBS domain-containing protein [bacterium]|nr:MAG: CBS domain-containing protein [bacterium]